MLTLPEGGQLIQWSEQAEQDLESHYQFMAMVGIWNPDDVIDRIIEAVEQLALSPKMGRCLEGSLHKLTIKDPKYVIHYALRQSDLLIVRVYHHRQNREL